MAYYSEDVRQSNDVKLSLTACDCIRSITVKKKMLEKIIYWQADGVSAKKRAKNVTTNTSSETMI